MRIITCTDPVEWDSYVKAHPQAANYHRWIWKKLIEDTYGHETFYLIAKDEKGVQGVLPLVAIKSWLFGRFLVSLPFFSYGGVLASTPEAREELQAKAVELADELSANHVELRQGGAFATNWHEAAAKVAMQVPLPTTTDQLFESLSPRLRNKIRRAQKLGLRAQWGGLESVDDFYAVFADNMHNLGTPVYPRAWFYNFLRAAPAESRILTLWDDGQVVAGCLLTAFRDSVELPWIASNQQARRKYSTVLLYWTALEWALRNGYRRVDLGRCTRGGGTYQFKTQWNCQEVPLRWYYWLRHGRSVPALRPSNPGFSFAIRVWKRLPVRVANVLGPHIVRALP